MALKDRIEARLDASERGGAPPGQQRTNTTMAAMMLMTPGLFEGLARMDPAKATLTLDRLESVVRAAAFPAWGSDRSPVWDPRFGRQMLDKIEALRAALAHVQTEQEAWYQQQVAGLGPEERAAYDRYLATEREWAEGEGIGLISRPHEAARSGP
jgi:hypothetical protein